MNKKLLFLMWISLLLPLLTFSQTLKTYSGEYRAGDESMGKAIYTYYEDPITHNYVKHGQFKFSKKTNTYSAIFVGNFKNGKREGLWTFEINRIDDPANNVYYTGTIRLNSNYLEGLPNGLWQYSNSMKYRAKLGIYNWSNYEVIAPESATATFRNGSFIGAFKAVNDFSFSLVSGEYSGNGFPNKEWVFRGKETEYQMTFNNGILYSGITREMPSGKVVSKWTDNAELINLENDYLQGKITNAELQKKRIKIDTTKNDLYYLSNSFYNPSFDYINIEGDEMYIEGKNMRLPVYIIFVKDTFQNLSSISYFKEAQNENLKPINERNYYTKKSAYEKILSDADRGYLKLSEEDIKAISDSLELASKEDKIDREKNEEFKKAMNDFDSHVYYLALPQLTKYIDKYKNRLTLQEKNDIDSKIKVINVYLKEKKTEDSIVWVKKKIENRNDTISNIYFVSSIFAQPGDSPKKVKDDIYDFYTSYYKSFKWSKWNDSKYPSMESALDSYNNFKQLQSKIIFLKSIKNTKKLEKQIHEAQNEEEKINLIINFQPEIK